MSYQSQQQPRPRARYNTSGVIIPDSMIDEEFRGEYDGSSNLIYKGFARPGTPTSANFWQVAKLTYDGSGNVLSILWPRQLVPSAPIISEFMGTVTTPWTSFSGTLIYKPINRGSLVITVGSLIFIDQGDGTLIAGGSNTGTINYTTGAVALTINPALLADTNVFADYDESVLGTASNDYLFSWDNRANYTYL